MPRQRRVKGLTGIYHVMLRGVNRQQIFQDDEDYQMLLYALGKNVREKRCLLYAYCLMGNHMHFLLLENTEELAVVMKRISCSFVYHYNKKYGRIGPLFQERYRSLPVDEEMYFIRTFHYIHENPVKAGLCERAEAYPYSSLQEYLSGKTGLGLCELDDVLPVLGGREELLQPEGYIGPDPAEIEMQHRMTDQEAMELLQMVSGCQNLIEFQRKPIEEKRSTIVLLHKKYVNLRQLAQLTGMSMGVIRSILAQER